MYFKLMDRLMTDRWMDRRKTMHKVAAASYNEGGVIMAYCTSRSRRPTLTLTVTLTLRRFRPRLRLCLRQIQLMSMSMSI